MANETTRILGLDPGLRRTGWGVIESEGSRLRWIAHGVVAPDDKAPFSQRLLHLLETLSAICTDHGCDEAAVEEVFVNMNPASTLKLGHARAAGDVLELDVGVEIDQTHASSPLVVRWLPVAASAII